MFVLKVLIGFEVISISEFTEFYFTELSNHMTSLDSVKIIKAFNVCRNERGFISSTNLVVARKLPKGEK